jgi:hypothetical protein
MSTSTGTYSTILNVVIASKLGIRCFDNCKSDISIRVNNFSKYKITLGEGERIGEFLDYIVNSLLR